MNSSSLSLTWGLLLLLALAAVGGVLWWRARSKAQQRLQTQAAAEAQRLDADRQQQAVSNQLGQDTLAAQATERAEASERAKRLEAESAGRVAAQEAARAEAQRELAAQNAARAAHQEAERQEAAREQAARDEAVLQAVKAQALAQQRAAKAAEAAAQDAAREAALLAAERAAELAAGQAALHAAQRAADHAARQAAERAAQEQAARRAAEDKHAAELHAREAQEARAKAELEAAATAEAEAAAAATPPATPPRPRRRPEETLVMVADDSKVVRVKTSRLLQQHNYRVVLAEDGRQAAALIDAEVPLVLITDVEMPGMDGFELTRHVRSHPLAAHIPIIMITSADDRLKAAAAEAGVTLVLGKPYAEEALLACIAQAQAVGEAAAA